MNQRENKIILEIYKDCLQLNKRKELAEYGRGQMDLCLILLRIGK